MYFADYHCHTEASPDAEGTLERYLESARRVGVEELAITDHFDINSTGTDGDFHYIAALHQKNMDYAARRKGTPCLRMGIELGMASCDPVLADEVLGRQDYDVVLSSYHNNRNTRDFFYLDYSVLDVPKLFAEYLDQVEENWDYTDFDICAHVTYPHRYIAQALPAFDPMAFRARFEQLFKKLIAMDKTLEINTSTLRKGHGFALPDYRLAKCYYDLGGRLISLGSDAHQPDDVGADIPAAAAALREIGFLELATFEKRKRIMRPL